MSPTLTPPASAPASSTMTPTTKLLTLAAPIFAIATACAVAGTQQAIPANPLAASRVFAYNDMPATTAATGATRSRTHSRERS